MSGKSNRRIVLMACIHSTQYFDISAAENRLVQAQRRREKATHDVENAKIDVGRLTEKIQGYKRELEELAEDKKEPPE